MTGADIDHCLRKFPEQVMQVEKELDETKVEYERMAAEVHT